MARQESWLKILPRWTGIIKLSKWRKMVETVQREWNWNRPRLFCCRLNLLQLCSPARQHFQLPYGSLSLSSLSVVSKSWRERKRFGWVEPVPYCRFHFIISTLHKQYPKFARAGVGGGSARRETFNTELGVKHMIASKQRDLVSYYHLFKGPNTK